MKSVFSSCALRAAALLIVVGYVSTSHAQNVFAPSLAQDNPNFTRTQPFIAQKNFQTFKQSGIKKDEAVISLKTASFTPQENLLNAKDSNEIKVYAGKNPAQRVQNNLNYNSKSSRQEAQKIGATQYITASESVKVIKNNQISKTQILDLHIIIGCEKQKLCSYKVMDNRPVPAFVVYVPKDVWSQIKDKKNAKAYFEEVIHSKIRESKQIKLDSIDTASGQTDIAQEAQAFKGVGAWFSRVFGRKDMKDMEEKKEEIYSTQQMEALHTIEVLEADKNTVLQKYKF